MGRSRSDLYDMKLESELLVSKPLCWLARFRQEKLLQVYLVHTMAESGKEDGNGFEGNEEGSFCGVCVKHLRRGRGWQPRRMSDSARSVSNGQRENGV